MRKLKCFETSGVSVQDVLDEFNERSTGLGITEDDIVSVTAYPPPVESVIKIAKNGSIQKSELRVVIVFWTKN